MDSPFANYLQLPSGVMVPEHVAEAEARKCLRPTCLDLFSGCGGFSLGMIRAGFNVVAGMDHDPIAAITYMHNLGTYPCRFHFASDEDAARLEKEMTKHLEETKAGVAYLKGACEDRFQFHAGAGYMANTSWQTELDPEVGVSHFFFGDVRRFSGKQILEAIGLEIGELDCIVGGPPCQGFSRANKNKNVMDPRNSLVFEFARLICEINPKTMVMENVPGILNMVTPEGIPVIDKFMRILEDGGFGGVSAFEKALEQQIGNIGLVRRKGAKKKTTPTSAKEKEQGRLFEEAS